MANNILKENKFTYISLFSGCGGFDVGFESNGFKCLGAFDNDPTVIATYKKNLRGPAYIHDLSKHTLPIPIEPGTVDVVISGSPCQGFSTAGLRKLEDPRNHLLIAGGNIALKLRAKVFVAENVMGSLSGEHKVYWEKLKDSLTEAGYNINFLRCEGTEMGLAQIRKRIFMIAWLGNSEVDLGFMKTSKSTLRDILTNVQNVSGQNLYYKITNENVLKIISKIKPGQKLCNVRGGVNSVHTWDIPDVYGIINEEENEVLQAIKHLRRKIRLRKVGDADPVLKEDVDKYLQKDCLNILRNLQEKKYIKFKDGRYDLVNTYNGLYRRLKWDEPSMTVDTRFGSARFFVHPEENRGFSVRETARIQGFEDTFIFEGNINQQYKMIGNAVPPPMAKFIAQIIKERILHNAK